MKAKQSKEVSLGINEGITLPEEEKKTKFRRKELICHHDTYKVRNFIKGKKPRLLASDNSA